jgi:type IV fimbrial biogenesis protein FimT
MNMPIHRCRSTSVRARSRGFTLAEMTVTLAVLATLVTLAVSSFNSVLSSMKLTALSNSFLSQLHMARSEAIKRNARVAMCKSPDGVTCVATGGWEQGLIVFHDANNNGSRGSGEPVVYRMEALPPGFRLMGNFNVQRYVSFSSDGAAHLMSGAFQAGTLTLCRQSEASAEAREIVINSVGRVRIRRTTVPSCT